MRSNFTIRQLRAFVLVAERSGFTQAADELHLTQSSISLLVRELERELGFRLFERSTRKVRLSSAGAEFYPFAQKVLEEVESAALSARQLNERKSGRVRIAATALYSATLIPEAIGAFRMEYPSIVVRLADMLNEQVLASVLNGTVDFGVAPQQRPPASELVQTPLLLDRFFLICPTSHRLARMESVPWKTALEFPFVNLTHDYMSRLQSDLHAWSNELIIKSVQEVSYFSTVLGLIKAGQGITALPAHTLPLTRSYDLTAVPLCDPVIERQVSIFMRRDRALSPAAESLLTFLREHVGQPGEPASSRQRLTPDPSRVA